MQNDAIYLGVAAQVLGCVTDWAWWLYAVIPLYLVWHGGKFLLSLWPKPKAEVTEVRLSWLMRPSEGIILGNVQGRRHASLCMP